MTTDLLAQPSYTPGWAREDDPPDPGASNVFVRDVHVAGRPHPTVSRRDSYKIALLFGRTRIHYADPASPYHAMFGPVYSASKTALNAITLSMMVELGNPPIKVRLASPAFTRTALTGYLGLESVEEGAREVVRVALLGPDDPSNTFTQWENTTIPW